MKTLLDSASRCARSQGSQVQQDDSDLRVEQIKAQTCAKRTEAREAEESLGRCAARPLDKRWRTHLFLSCDKESGSPREVPFPGLGLAIRIMRATQKLAVSASCDKGSHI